MTQMKSAETNAVQINYQTVWDSQENKFAVCAYKHLTATSTPGDWKKEKWSIIHPDVWDCRL